MAASHLAKAEGAHATLAAGVLELLAVQLVEAIEEDALVVVLGGKRIRTHAHTMSGRDNEGRRSWEAVRDAVKEAARVSWAALQGRRIEPCRLRAGATAPHGAKDPSCLNISVVPAPSKH